jgi:transcriptional regulator with XRE-family HTH domain
MLKDCEILHAERRRSGLTQKDLAKRVGVSSVFISQIEGGRQDPNRDMANRISYALHMDPHKLFPLLFADYDAYGTSRPRTEPLKERPLTHVETVIRKWHNDPDSLTIAECQIAADFFGKNLFLVFPDRFDRLGNEIKQNQKMDVSK